MGRQVSDAFPTWPRDDSLCPSSMPHGTPRSTRLCLSLPDTDSSPRHHTCPPMPSSKQEIPSVLHPLASCLLDKAYKRVGLGLFKNTVDINKSWEPEPLGYTRELGGGPDFRGWGKAGLKGLPPDNTKWDEGAWFYMYHCPPFTQAHLPTSEGTR